MMATGESEQYLPSAGRLSLSLAGILVDGTGKISKPGAFGTGFLITNRIVLSCYHVLQGRDVSRKSAITLRWRDRGEETLKLLPECHCDLKENCNCQEGVYFFNQKNDWAIVSCEPPKQHPLPPCWCIHLDSTALDDPIVNFPLVVCGHPLTGSLRMSFGSVLKLKKDWFQFSTVSEEASVGGTSGGPVFRADGNGLLGILATTLNPSHKRNGPILRTILFGILEQLRERRPILCLAHFRENCELCCFMCVEEAVQSFDFYNGINLMYTAKSGTCSHIVPCDYFPYGCTSQYLPCPKSCVCHIEGVSQCQRAIHRQTHAEHHTKLLQKVADAGMVCFPPDWKRRAAIQHPKDFENGYGLFGQRDGRFDVTASSCDSSLNQTSFCRLTNSSPQYRYCFTKDLPNSWVSVDLGTNYSMVVTQYALQHGQGWARNSLRNWRFEGSVDNKTWVLLREHVQDTTLSGSFATGCWVVSNTPPYPCQHFRIFQTGPNSSDSHVLALCSFQIYGFVGTRLTNEKEEEEEEELRLSLSSLPPLGIHLIYSVDFKDESPFDGILQWIGSNQGRSRYSNPAKSGKVKVQTSNLSPDLEAENLCRWISDDRSKMYCYTTDEENSWFSLDLGEDLRASPSHYTLRHGQGWKRNALRNWVLQGSNNEKTWTNLSIHQNDRTIGSSFATGFWEVSERKKDEEKGDDGGGNGGEGVGSFRYFRVLQTGRNSSDNHTLCVTGFEMFGSLFSLSL